MLNSNYVEKIKGEFESVVHLTSGPNDSFEVSAKDLFSLVEYLKKELQFIILRDICVVDNLERNNKNFEKRFEVHYYFLNLENYLIVSVVTRIDESDKLDSIVEIFESANWYEREVFDLFGLEFKNKVYKRLLTHNLFSGHPLLKDFKHINSVLEATEDFNLEQDETSRNLFNHNKRVSLGPASPAFRGVFRLISELEGEMIKSSTVEIGYAHRGIEKISESMSFLSHIDVMDKLNLSLGQFGSLVFCEALEKLYQIDIPKRAKAIRMVISELSRIVDHSNSILSVLNTIGLESGHMICRDIVMSTSRILSALIQTTNNSKMIFPGGVEHDIPGGWVSGCFEHLIKMEGSVNNLSKILTKSRLWMERTCIGTMSAIDAIEWGISGPYLRATGIKYDVRKNRSYYFYDDVDFDIPLGVSGDCYNFYLVKLEEIRQSIRIIIQVLDNIPLGILQSSDLRLSPKDKLKNSSNLECLIKHSKLFTEGLIPPVRDVYSSIESANGELGIFLVSDGRSTPYRLKIVVPTFPICQYFPKFIEGHNISDVAVAVNSFDLVSASFDR